MTNKQEPIYSREYSTMELIVKATTRGRHHRLLREKVRQNNQRLVSNLTLKARDEARYENKEVANLTVGVHFHIPDCTTRRCLQVYSLGEAFGQMTVSP